MTAVTPTDSISMFQCGSDMNGVMDYYIAFKIVIQDMIYCSNIINIVI